MCFGCLSANESATLLLEFFQESLEARSFCRKDHIASHGFVQISAKSDESFFIFSERHFSIYQFLMRTSVERSLPEEQQLQTCVISASPSSLCLPLLE